MATTQAREGAVDVPGARLFVRELGAGPPLVVLHGGPDFDHHYMLPEMDRLAGAFRLIYYDQRGRGRSTGGAAPGEVTLTSELDDLDHVRRHLRLERLALLGHSWGALLAMEYAASAPERVGHLVLLNPAPGSHADWARFRDRRERADAGTLAAMRAIAATPEYARGDVEAEARYHRLHFRAAVRSGRDLDALLGRLRAHFTPDGIVRARAIEDRLYDLTWRRPDYDVIRRLAARPPRTLVIHGASDLIPAECAESIARGVPGAHLMVLEACGHFAYVDRPAEVLAAIVERTGGA